ncbi:MAG: UDP-N-acetylglucosamine 2-epimerase (non-hydrolyzing), partial [candidate division WOR-3 bacterium]
MRWHVLVAFGTRPEAIKLAPVIRELRRHRSSFRVSVLVTGQHREMLVPLLRLFKIKPGYDLGVMRTAQTLGDLSIRVLRGAGKVLAAEQPDVVLVQGDATSAFAVALAAYYQRIPVGHVEAGLRTYDKYAPFPEELNRRFVSAIADIHFAPTPRAAENLQREGVPAHACHVTGNTVIDALLWTLHRERQRNDYWRQKYAFLGERPLVLITGHRRENFGAGMEALCRAVAELAQRLADVEFLYPVHLNPNVQEPVRRLLRKRERVHLVAPVPYPEFVWLMDRARLILTDSGGIQEEAPSLRRPVLVMRETTERPEAVEAGAVELVGTDVERIVERTIALLCDPQQYAARQIDHNPYGDGRAA